ncbi:DNA repair exonuclease [Lysobacter sp. Root983]|uniref:metallophosphoesterase family protein n=1 Tax=Lysobacter sp. Root983 TaxID=1736613 RepID=UPI0007108A57|nr:DNA repair exonuclease [Lysobacter sp. Root983]KRD80500.1 metallophosphatase [Lysobacter sp. Root983]
MRILHTADWQVGKPFGGFELDDSMLLTAARIEAIKVLAGLAQDRLVDAVLVAGDVFDAQTISDKTIQQTFNALAGFPGIWVFLPGNHDAALAESVWTRAQRLKAVPANAILCLEAVPTPILDGRVVILPAPLNQRNTYNDLTQWFSSHETPEGVIRIGLAHGSVQGILPDTIDSPNPIAQGRAAQARLDYLALGDWHSLKQVDDRTWYSGTPETDRFRSPDPGYALIVEVAAGAEPQVLAEKVGHYLWKSMAFVLNVPGDLDVFEEALAELSERDVVEIEITGNTDLAGRERIHAALSRAQGRIRALRADMTGMRLLPSQEDLDALQADGYLAETIQDLRAQQNTSADQDLARDALVMLASTLHLKGRSEPPA